MKNARAGAKKGTAAGLMWRPLALETWADFDRLFGERGACGGCWCMSWRRARADFNAGKSGGNKRLMRKMVRSGLPLGVLLYTEGHAVGWCSVAPREQFVALRRSRVWAPIDDRPVWSVSCFFLLKEHRRHGLSVELLRAAVEFARQHGARIVEGYPQELDTELPGAFVWTGLAQSYKRAGFEVAARRSRTKPIMRYQITE